MFHERKKKFKAKKLKKRIKEINITFDTIFDDNLLLFNTVIDILRDEIIAFLVQSRYRLHLFFKKTNKKLQGFVQKIKKYTKQLVLFKHKLRKPIQLIFLNTKTLFTLSVKNLHVEKKRMLLLNTKKTQNNFWGWIRTHIIYFIPKIYNKIKNYFYNFRVERTKIKQMEQQRHLLQQNKEDEITNNHRIARKIGWLKEQIRQQRIQKGKYKLKKQYNIQKQEYYNYLEKKAALKKQKEMLNTKYATANYKLNFWNTLQRLVLITIENSHSFFHNFVKPATAVPQIQYVNPKIPETLSNYFEAIPKFFFKKLSGLALRDYKEAQRSIKRRFVEPTLFKKLKQQYKRDRKGLFNKITEILKERADKKYIYLFLIKMLKRAVKKVKQQYKRNYKKFIKNIKLAPKLKLQNITFNTVNIPFKLFEYNLNAFSTILLKLFVYEDPKQHFIFEKLAGIRDYFKINFAEIKRILPES